MIPHENYIYGYGFVGMSWFYWFGSWPRLNFFPPTCLSLSLSLLLYLWPKLHKFSSTVSTYVPIHNYLLLTITRRTNRITTQDTQPRQQNIKMKENEPRNDLPCKHLAPAPVFEVWRLVSRRWRLAVATADEARAGCGRDGRGQSRLAGEKWLLDRSTLREVMEK